MSNKRIKKKKARELHSCVLCGMPLFGTPHIVGKTGRGVCDTCLLVSKVLLASKVPPPVVPHSNGIITPQAMIRELDKSIIGQDRAKRAVSVAFWKQQLRVRGADIPNPGLLLYGPTGCGKTAIAREAAKVAGLPFITFDATTLSETGYRGCDPEEMVKKLIEYSDREKAAHGVIFLDEVDKLSAQGGESRMAYNKGTQHALLKLIEGYEVDGVDTSGILFLFGGAFSGLTAEKPERKVSIGFDREMPETDHPCRELQVSDFVSYGMEPELMGRICRCVPLSPLTEDDMRHILTESQLSSFLRYQKFYESQGRQLHLDKDAETQIIQRALERGTGARGLNTMVEEWMEEKLITLAEEGRSYEHDR